MPHLAAQLRSHLPSIIALTMLTTLLGLIYIATAKRDYTASSAIFVDPRARRIVSEDVAPNGYGTDTTLFETQVSIIGSDAILRRVVMAEKLHVDADFISPARTGLLSRLSDGLRGARASFDPVDQAVEMLARSTRVRRAQNTYVVAVDVTTGDAVKSARLANAILKAYQDDQSAAKADAAARTNAAIDGRLEELKGQVRKAEVGVDSFRRESRIVTSEGGLLNEQQLTKYNTELAAVRGQVATSKARLEEMTSTLRRGISPESLLEAMTSPVVQRLREQLATAQRREAALSSQLQSRHPVMVDAAAQVTSVRSQITAELRRIAEQAQNDYQLATGREREILKTLDASQREVSETTTAQIRLRELEREADASREVAARVSRACQGNPGTAKPQCDGCAYHHARVRATATVKPAHSACACTVCVVGARPWSRSRHVCRRYQPEWATPTTQPRPTEPRTSACAPWHHCRRSAQFHQRDKAIGGVASSAEKRLLAHRKFWRHWRIRTRPSKSAYRSAVERIADRLRRLGPESCPQVLLMVSSAHGAGTSLSALAIAYVRAHAGERVLLIDAASADPALSEAFAGDLQQHEPCMLDSKDHLAAITSREPETGLTFLPIALADLRTLPRANGSACDGPQPADGRL